MGCHQTIEAVVFMTLAITFSNFYSGGCLPNVLDIAPNYAGVIMGIASTVGQLAGCLGPAVVGLFTENEVQIHYSCLF